MPITVAAISLDGKELAKSASVLIVRLTDVSNTGMLFGNETRQLVKKTGALPLLLRRGSATVEFADGRPCKITALNCDGGSTERSKARSKTGFAASGLTPRSFPAV